MQSVPTFGAMTDFERDRRLRNWTLIPFVVLGIVAGALLGLAFGLGAIGQGAATRGNPGGLIFFAAPPMVFGTIGWLLYRLLSRRSAAS